MNRPGHDIATRVEQAVCPLLERQGYEIVLVEYVPRSRVLRLFVDHAVGVSVDDCAGISRLVGDVLDGEGISDLVDDRYTLEVSSPGLDRPLVKPQHFQRFVGHRAQVRTREPQQGRRKFRGELVEADEAGIRIDIDGQSCAIDYTMIESARLVPEL